MFFLTLLLVIIATDNITGHGSRIYHAVRQGVPFTFGPFLYIYTNLMIKEKQRLHKTELLHFLPFIVVSILLLAGVTVQTPGYLPPFPQELPPGGIVSLMPNPGTRWLIIFTSANLSYIIYTVLILTKLSNHKKNLADYFSNESSDITLRWLRILTILFILSNILTGILILIFPLGVNGLLLNPNIIICYGLIFFIFAFALFSGKQPLIYNSNARQDTGNDIPKKYEKSGLKEEDIRIYISELEDYMKKDKPYLDSELTIVDISDSLDIKRHHITQILNDRLNVNFNTYINNLRVDYITEKMKDNSLSNVSLLELALDSGFNSKTTFNRVFKNKTGKTPSQYKKDLTMN